MLSLIKKLSLIAVLLFFASSTLILTLWISTSAQGKIVGSIDMTEQRTDRVHLAYITSVLEERITGLSLAQEQSLAVVILEESRAYSVDPLLVMAIIETESTYYNRARSNKGAIGLMQIMPATGVWVAEMLEVNWHGEPTLYDPHTNVRLGTMYFSMLRKRFDNDTHISLAAYNAGPTNVSARIRHGRTLPVVYADKVLKSYKELKEDFSNTVAEAV